MIIGIDFDNTLACYDGLFYSEAINRNLLPDNFTCTQGADKTEVRNFLRSIGKEEEFTKLQGHIYGKGILQAKIFENAKETLHIIKKYAKKLYIVSHKTKYPYLGQQYNLHECADNWLEEKGFYNDLLKKEDVFFELSKEEKLKRISDLQCTHFIDDLPEILQHELFPNNTKALLFKPSAFPSEKESTELETFFSWKEIEKALT